MSIIIRNRLDPDNLLPGVTIFMGVGGVAVVGRAPSTSVGSTSVTRSPVTGAITLTGKVPTISIGSPGSQLWPGSFNDPVFTGMTTLNSTYNVPDGGTVSHRSTIESSGDPTAAFGDNGGTLSFCRIQSRECVRHQESTHDYLIDWCYLEATGSGADHADVVQAYAGGGAGGNGQGTLTIRNTMLVLGGASTACLFSADNFGGKFFLNNVCMQPKSGNPGNRGLSINADGGNTLAVDGLYIVRSPSFQQFDIDVQIPITSWANAYHCDLDGNGQPINLTSISEP